jgi:mediator of RNA polymerase II transcription subunit 16
VREGSNYRYETAIVPAFPPWHPNHAKTSLLAVSANGLLRLLYVQNSNANVLEEISIELEAVTSSDELITHAALCSEKARTQRESIPVGFGGLLACLAAAR